MVFLGLVILCLAAKIPTNLSPDFVNATTEGIKTEPSLDSMHFGSPWMTLAIFEIDVPKSIPKALDIKAIRIYEYHPNLQINYSEHSDIIRVIRIIII
jgi:hypothetical protein